VRILIHSNGPMVATGYGRQVELLAPRLKELGHEVAISAFSGLSGSSVEWDGVTVFPQGQLKFGLDMIEGYADLFEADLVLTLMDVRMLDEAAPRLKRFKTLAWTAVDCSPVSRPDLIALEAANAKPLAMSRFGQRQLEMAGFKDVPYAPHVVDTAVFAPPADVVALRQAQDLDPDLFLIGICAANSDVLRKGWPEQFEAFRRFADGKDDVRLLVHSLARSVNGFPLDQMARDIGIAEKVMFSDSFAQLAGLMTPEVMADWFGCIDLLSLCSYGEGFGVPLIEAQACGTPVVTTDGSAMTELGRVGFLVKSDAYWNPIHRAWWRRPHVAGIASAYNRAYKIRNSARSAEESREAFVFAQDYSADLVIPAVWGPLLESLAEA
jgi:glycosyltransferase involved in cell wall biosynthesis